MKALDCKQCKVHVLVCTNERPDKSCCKRVGGQELFQKLKQKLKDSGLYDTHWITRTGCLGFCNDVGTVVTITRREEPTQWFSEVTPDEMQVIWDEITRDEKL
jgi:predicted metal-binding protein